MLEIKKAEHHIFDVLNCCFVVETYDDYFR